MFPESVLGPRGDLDPSSAVKELKAMGWGCGQEESMTQEWGQDCSGQDRGGQHQAL